MEPIRLTRAQAREVDRIAIDEYGIPGVILMENAGRHVAQVCDGMIEGALRDVLIVCGGGNNGGDGYVIARHLGGRLLEHQRVTVLALAPIETLSPDARTMAAAVQKMSDVQWSTDPSIIDRDWSLVVDAIYGTGLSRAPRDHSRHAIELINQRDRNWTKVVAVDVPSGLDCDTGEPIGVAVRATTTVTFVAEKVGFANPAAKAYLGKVVIADIGAPMEIIDRITAQ